MNFLVGSRPECIGLSGYRWTSQCLPVMLVNVVILLSQSKFSASRLWEGVWGARCSTEINTHGKDEMGGDLSIYRFCYPQEVLNQPLMDTEETVHDWCIPKEWFCSHCITTDSGWQFSGGFQTTTEHSAYLPCHSPVPTVYFCQKRSQVFLSVHFDRSLWWNHN